MLPVFVFLIFKSIHKPYHHEFFSSTTISQMLTVILSAIQWQSTCISFSITDSHIQMSTQFSSWDLLPHSGPNYTSWLAVWGYLSGVFLDLRTQREHIQWRVSPSEQAKNSKFSFDRTRMSHKLSEIHLMPPGDSLQRLTGYQSWTYTRMWWTSLVYNDPLCKSGVKLVSPKPATGLC